MDVVDVVTVADRIDPPPGWRYRVRKLRRPLDVAAQAGKATIIQDEALR